MNIGIYGDSYVCYNDWLPINDWPYAESNIRKSWVEYVKDHHNVTSYGLSASNLSYTHKMVLAHHTSHDINIVLVTNYGRLNLPNLISDNKYVSGINNAESRLANCTYASNKTILSAAVDYYLHIENKYEVTKFHYLMVDDIKSKVPNAIIVPCFPQSISHNRTKSMFDISMIDSDYYKIDRHVIDTKRCHINDKNNNIFANKMLEHINHNLGNEFKINLSDYVEPIGEPIEYNFTV